MSNFDLNYIFSDNNKVKKIEDQGFDLDTLFYMCKDLFLLLDELNSNPRELAEILMRLKIAFDASKGKPVADLVLYENNRAYPSRLSVESRITRRTYFFRLLEDQHSVDKLAAKYKCELCPVEVLSRTDVKNHVVQVHELSSYTNN